MNRGREIWLQKNVSTAVFGGSYICGVAASRVRV